MQTLFDSVKWNTSPTAYWTIQYEYGRSGSSMIYRFSWKVWLGYSSSWYKNGLQLQLFLNGVQNNVTIKGYDSSVNDGWSYSGTTGWYTVSNKTSGTTPFYARLYDTSDFSVQATSSTYSLTVSSAASYLGAISNFDVDAGVTIPITKYDSYNTDTLVVSYGGTTVCTVPEITNGAKVVFDSNQLSTIYNLMKSVNSGTFTFTLTSKSGSTTIGTSTQTATGSITGANPTYSEANVTYADTYDAIVNITGTNQHIVQGKSSLSVYLAAATGNKGATISQYTVVVNGVTKTLTAAGTAVFGVINSASDLTATVTVTDSRGNTTKVERKITVVPYTAPSMDVTLERLNNYEDTTYLTVNGSISSVNGNNRFTLDYKYKVSGGSYGAEQRMASNTTYTLTCDKNYSYIFSITITDRFGAITKEYTLDRGAFPLFIDTQKNAVGVNEFPTSGEALRVAGGVACFDDGIVLKSGNKSFKITVNDNCYCATFDGFTEWINPPMVIGTEYRTTERWNGKPVYIKAVNIGTLSQDEIEVITPTPNLDVCVDVGGVATNTNGDGRTSYVLPRVRKDRNIYLSAMRWINSDLTTDIYIYQSADASISTFTATVWVKYTKTTD